MVTFRLEEDRALPAKHALPARNGCGWASADRPVVAKFCLSTNLIFPHAGHGSSVEVICAKATNATRAMLIAHAMRHRPMPSLNGFDNQDVLVSH
jgi:hypothetical protein